MWKKLTIDDVRLTLAEDEVQKLENLSTNLDSVIQDTIDAVSDAFRASWSSKGYVVDVRDHWIDTSYEIFILAMIRWQLWTRFPMSDNYALSEPRKLEYQQALELLKNPYLATSTPDYSTDPELSSTTIDNSDKDIFVPFLRFPPLPFGEFCRWLSC